MRSPATDSRDRRLAAGARLVAARVAFCMALGTLVWACAEEPSARSAVMEWAATLAERASPGRLVGERRHQPYRQGIAETGGPGGRQARLLRLATVRVLALSESAESGESAADRAVLELLSGDLGTAVSRLRLAVALDSAPAAMSDLAAAHLARADREDRVMDLLYAADAARRAAEADPRLPEAAFNLAVALTRLHVPRTAAAQWNRFLDLEPAGPWAAEAKDHVAWLRARGSAIGWPVLQRRLLGDTPPGEADLAAAVSMHPHQARRLAERELFGRWADEVLAGRADPAAEWLARARSIALLLARDRGESLLERETARLGSAGRESARRENARAVRAFLEASAHYEVQQYASARSRLEAVQPVLLRQESALAAIAELYLAVCLYYDDLPGAGARLKRLLDGLPEEFRALRGETLWMLGIVAGGQRQFEAAVDFYRRAMPLVEAVEGPTRAATLRLLMADVFDSRGEVERGWRLRLEALGELAGRGEARRRYGAAFEAAQALTRHGHDELALVFLDEAVTTLDEYDAPAGGAEIHLQRARIFIARRERAQARRELARAGEYVGRVEDSGLKDRLAAALALTSGMADAEPAPARAVATLEQAYRKHQASGYRFDELAYLAALARAQRAMGDLAAVGRTLRAAVESYEETRIEAGELISSVESMRRSHDLFDQLIALSLDGTSGEETEAFHWAERSRAQTLLDWRSHPGMAAASDRPAIAGIGDLRRGLSPGTVVVEYSVLADRTICWVVSASGARFHSLAIAKGRLADLGDAFVKGLLGGASTRVLEDQAAELYEALLTPLELDLSAIGRLVVIPDGPLRGLPFSALVDPGSGRFLIEQVAVALAPSATLLLMAERDASRVPIARPLVIGSARLRHGPYRDLPDLLFAEKEAAAVASVFPGSTTLFDETATVERLVRLLPSHDALHYSGHALSPRDGWESSALVLSPDSRNREGLLRVTALRSQARADLRLVTLSACETLAGYDGGREGTIGLAHAFFALGVPSVVAARWPVDDRTSYELMRSFYQGIRSGAGAAQALRWAIVEGLEGPGARRSMATWAAFAVIGV